MDMNTVVVEIDNTASEESLKKTLEQIKINRDKRKEPNLSQFFGILPDFDDGLEFQKVTRNEWN